MGQIFISYSRRDSDFVDRLIHDLAAGGLNVWMDRTGIEGGEKWRAAIAQAVRECEAFILVLSPQSAASDNVTKEVSLADSHKRRIIPLRYQPCEIPPQMEYQLTEFQWVDFSNKPYANGLDELVRALKLAGGAPKPAPRAETWDQPPPPPPPPTLSLIQILPGTWQINYGSPVPGVGGQLNLQIFPNGLFRGQNLSPMGMTMVEGRWQVSPLNQLTLQGTQTNGFQAAPYLVIVQFTQVAPNQLFGTSMAGEPGQWQRIA